MDALALAERMRPIIDGICATGDVLRPVAGAVVVHPSGNLLMVYSDYADQGWHFPKGGLDEGETTLTAALREGHEETGGVSARPLDSDAVVVLPPGGRFTGPLGFGSPRCETHGPPGLGISLAAAQLLDRAATALGLTPAEFGPQRVAVFDELKRMDVDWQVQATYHVLVYASGTPLPTWESAAVAWVEPRAVNKIGRKTHSHVRQLLEWPEWEVTLRRAQRACATN